MHIAIIGAGLSGLTCARQLQAQGHSVTVYEKSRSISGRMSTRETEFGGFDHGAQFFTADSAGFKKQVGNWKKTGLVVDWPATLVRLSQGVAKSAGRSKKRYVAIPGMGALCRHQAEGLDIRTEQRIMRIEPLGQQWLLALQSDTVPIEATAGPFDAVVVALPAEQAGALLEVAPILAKQAKKAGSAPCWALLMGFQTSLELGYDGAWVDGSRLAWIVRDASKPQHRDGERWVAHASPEWSAKHLEDDEERITEKLLKAFHEATGSDVQPVHAWAHRWRYAQAIHLLADDCLWQQKLRIGACGDWFANGLDGAGRVENAYLSGLALAKAIGK